MEDPENTILRFDHSDISVHNIERKYDGFFKVDQYQLNHQQYNGTNSELLTREIFERGDAVVLIPYDPINDKLVLIEQFRVGAIRTNDTPWLLEFVAGMFAENERPIDVAIREAKEEANLTIAAHDVNYVMKFLSSPGGTSECIHLYVANINSENVGGVYGLPEEGEDILVHVVSRQDALILFEQGKISNAATIIGLQWLQLNYKTLQGNWLK
ncbi:MAG: ADP-ribose pyrophosphatase [Alteromonadaceae bacterium]|jgi:ADP-ribose pyrophosphatase